ncbi:MAG: DUF3098 domain-containing protein [Ignavibacteriae bacterium]|nr:DUF3098 domain-containing protein [Ignavibacteriota bacterium]
MTKQVAKTVKHTGTHKTGTTRTIKQGKKKVKWEIPFLRKNAIIAAIGLGVILIGYILMSTGITNEPAVPNGKWNNPFAISVAPLLLVIGYCIIIPFALIKFYGKKGEPETSPEDKPKQ